MRTLGDQLKKYSNFAPGFNFARIFLAYSVLIWHTVAIAENTAEAAMRTVLWPFVYSILPMFFALSGFLVTASALRLPLREYVLNRGFRIVPALGVDITISALIFGPIVTFLPWEQYFSDRRFWSYFLNIVGSVHYELPGVFEANPYVGVVNGALWTVPYEIACYVIMSGLMILGLNRKWTWVLGITLALGATAILLDQFALGRTDTLIDKVLRFAFFDRGATLIQSFLGGSALYLLRDRIPYDWRLVACIVAAVVAFALLADPALAVSPAFVGMTAIPLAYAVVWIGLTPIPVPPFLEAGDYSYGIYLYHFPILQALQLLFDFSSWWQLAALGVVPVTLFAILSWHAIEKPTLKFRKRFSLVGSRLAAIET